MKPFLLNFCVISSLLAYSPFSQSKHISLADNGENTEFVINFVARSSDDKPGHAFVHWISTSEQQPVDEAFGKYPKSSMGAAGFGNVPGEIRQEVVEGPHIGLKVYVTKQMFDYTLSNTKAIRTGAVRYDANDDSCVDFVALVATSLPLKVPDSDYARNLPYQFVKKLIQIN